MQRNEKMNNDDNLTKVYSQLLALSGKLLNDDVSAIEIAPILVKCGLEIYKTVLSPAEYERMAEYIYDHRDDIKSLKQFMPELH